MHDNVLFLVKVGERKYRRFTSPPNEGDQTALEAARDKGERVSLLLDNYQVQVDPQALINDFTTTLTMAEELLRKRIKVDLAERNEVQVH